MAKDGKVAEMNPPADSDDDEEDEDYVQPAEGAESDGDGGGGGTGVGSRRSGKKGNAAAAVADEAGRPRLSTNKQRAVDDAFQSLFGRPLPSSTATKKQGKKEGPKSKKALKKRKSLLESMFGKSAAGRLVATASAVAESDAATRKRDGPLLGAERRLMTEKKVFAGREIEVTRTVMVDATAAAELAAPAAPPPAAGAGGGLDAVLANLGGLQKISTVAKTSGDWDTFKNKTGMEEELEEKAKGKDAFLVKQDFLTRVDQRTFAVEKSERDRKRASAGR